MSWSGKDVLLAKFLPRFHDRELCVSSLDRYIRSSRVLDDRRAHDWLEQDLARDKELAAIGDPENYALGPSRFDLGPELQSPYVERGDLHDWTGIDDPSYVHAEHCPRCQLARCWRCNQLERDPAGPNCTNPRWHWPNWRQGAPPQSPVPGWKSVGEALEP